MEDVNAALAAIHRMNDRKLREHPSAFSKHFVLLVEANYGVADALQRFTLSLYCGATVFVASKLRNFDDEHFAVFQELSASYRLHGEGDPAFMQIGRELQRRMRDEGAYT